MRQIIPISKQQLAVYAEIKKTYPEAKLNYPIKTKCCVRHGDIALPNQKIDIEVDSEFWHNNHKDHMRDKELKKVGWKTIRVKYFGDFF